MGIQVGIRPKIVNLSGTKKTLILLAFIITAAVVACTPAQAIEPETAQQVAANTLQTDLHAVWELDWSNAPVGGPLTVEIWQAGNRYRYEILEATTPALIGQTLVFDGQTGWQYNRLSPPETFLPVEPQLSPVTDALAIINQLLNTPPTTAIQEVAVVNGSNAKKTTLTYTNADTLTLWQNKETGLPLKVEFSEDNQQGTLQARSVENLVDPPPELFTVGEWVQNW